MIIKRYSDLVKLSHTIFALPFALIGFTLALTTTQQSFNWVILLQVLLCMLFARNTAMGFNRWCDRDIDAKNPRTADREIPAGKVSAKAALRFVIINALLFIGVAATINTLTAALSPVALAVVMGYSYCKRFTSMAHLVLGLGLGIAPVGAYIAVAGEFDILPMVLSLVVISWCGGFDIIYALQDRDFDIENGLHSIPSRLSVRGALMVSIALHVVSTVALILFAWFVAGAWWRWIGVGLFIGLLLLQHLLVTPSRQRNIGIAFGTVNGIASSILAIFMVASMIIEWL